MDLTLHIGTEKTATSATQRWLAENRTALRKHGVAYSRVLGAVTNRRLCLWALDPERADQGFLHIGIRTETERALFYRDLPGQFAEEVASAKLAGCRQFVISNEHCHSRLTSHAEVARVQDFLAPHFSQIMVVCAVRPQVDVAVSLASTVSRDRFRLTGAFFDRVTPENPYYNYADLTRRWSKVFGAENLTMLAFREWPSVAAWLFERFNLAGTDLTPIRRINEALDIQSMAIVNALQVPNFDGDGKPNPFGNLFLDKLPCNERLSLGEEKARAIQDRFNACNAELIVLRPEIKPDDLQPDWHNYARPSNLATLEAHCDFAGQMAEMVRIFNEQLQYQRLQTRMAQTERAIARSRWENARRFLLECMGLARPLLDASSVKAEMAQVYNQLSVLEGEIEALPLPGAVAGELVGRGGSE